MVDRAEHLLVALEEVLVEEGSPAFQRYPQWTLEQEITSLQDLAQALETMYLPLQLEQLLEDQGECLVVPD